MGILIVANNLVRTYDGIRFKPSLSTPTIEQLVNVGAHFPHERQKFLVYTVCSLTGTANLFVLESLDIVILEQGCTAYNKKLTFWGRRLPTCMLSHIASAPIMAKIPRHNSSRPRDQTFEDRPLKIEMKHKV